MAGEKIEQTILWEGWNSGTGFVLVDFGHLW